MYYDPIPKAGNVFLGSESGLADLVRDRPDLLIGVVRCMDEPPYDPDYCTAIGIQPASEEEQRQAAELKFKQMYGNEGSPMSSPDKGVGGSPGAQRQRYATKWVKPQKPPKPPFRDAACNFLEKPSVVREGESQTGKPRMLAPHVCYLEVADVEQQSLRLAIPAACDFMDKWLEATEMDEAAVKAEQRDGTQPPTKAIYVHCAAGKSRSACILASFLVSKRGFSLEDALAHIHECRPKVSPNDGFLQQLVELEMRLRADGTTSLDRRNQAIRDLIGNFGGKLAVESATDAIDAAGGSFEVASRKLCGM